MRQVEAWEIARRQLVDTLGQPVMPTVLFVVDDDVDYRQSGRPLVRRANLFDLESERWARLLEPQPSWLHFNLLEVDVQVSVVTVRRSRESVSPTSPHWGVRVNVSADWYAPAEIFE